METLSVDEAVPVVEERREKKRKKQRGLDAEAFHSIVKTHATEAVQWIETNISHERSKAWRYWGGKSDLREEKNRSKIVMTEASDVVEQSIPLLMDMYLGIDEPLMFIPTGEQQDFAFAATKTVETVFWLQNPGFMLLEEYLRDGLIAKTGIFKVYKDEKLEITEEEYSGLSYDQWMLLAEPDEVEVLELSPDEPEFEDDQPTFSCRIKRTEKRPLYKVETTKPENFIINEKATSIEPRCYTICGEVAEMTVSDAVAMGVPYEKAIARIGPMSKGEVGHQEKQQRDQRNNDTQDSTTEDQSTQPIVVYELYVYVDKDGDGLSELHKVIGIGMDVAEICHDEIVEDNPYCIGCPYPIPHTVIGRSQVDRLVDLQDITTKTVRATLDNLDHANNPRTEAVQNQVNMEDLLDNKFRGIVRVKAPGMTREIQVPFIGHQSLTILEYMEGRKESRVGVSKESSGLAAEALQSSSEVGVRAVLGLSQMQLRGVARRMAETGLAQLYRKILRLVVQHQDRPMQVSLGVNFINVDPSSWNIDMQVRVLIGLGTGTREERVQGVLQIMGMQEKILTQLTPDNPVCSLEHFAYSLHKFAELMRVGPSMFFFKSLEQVKQELPAWTAERKQQAQQQGKNADKVQAAQIKAQVDQQANQQKAQLKEKEIQQTGALKAQQQQQDMILERMKAQQKAQTDMFAAQVKAQAEQQRLAMEAWQKTQEMQMKQYFGQMEMMIEAKLEKYAIDKMPATMRGGRATNQNVRKPQ
jgi:hypothetical protein